ncbi:hypothetical protein L9F63_013046, partial [Diploptera punctata]
CEQSPGVYLRDDPLFGTQLQNQSELRVPTAEKAAFYLDAAYSVSGKGHGVAGGRSRLHLIDLGSCERGKASGGIPLSGLGNVLLAIFNGQKHLPYREHKVTQLLKECLSSLTCHAAMIAHVSPAAQQYTDTLATVQLASRIHRMRRRKIKFSGGSAGSGGSSGEEAAAARSDVDPSSSEQSADTVIYVGPSDDAATDGEHPPVYIPSLNSGDNRCAMGKALRGSGAEHRPPTKNDKGSPSHRSSSKTTNQSNSKNSSPSHNSSCKSSPVRNPSKNTSHKTSASTTDQQQCGQSQSSSKIPVPFGNTGGSDEQWIDGPRISKSKVAEARSLLKDSHKKKETWIDGPLQSAKVPTLSSGHSSGGYGFMDNHKKSMIRKWVENQTVQIQRQVAKHSSPTPPQRPPTTGAPQSHSYKELTVFKTCDEDENGVKDTSENKPPSDADQNDMTKLVKEEAGLMMPDVVLDVKCNAEMRKEEEERKVELMEEVIHKTEPEIVEEEDDVVGDMPPPLQLFQPHNKEISIDVSVDSLDVRLRILQERREAAGAVGDINVNEDDDEVEIIEVEEPFEPVPMQDSCLQVTEEDIALCMGELENMLTEGDQDSNEEHPLRILSQENLTVSRKFLLRQTWNGCFLDDNMDNQKHSADLLSNQTKFDQLARLHEMYKTKLARANVTKTLSSTFSPTLQYRPPSRCQSLSITAPGTGGSSIYSEPAYNPHRPLHQNQAKICDNCKMSFGRTGNGGSWYQPLLSTTMREHLPSHHPHCRSGCNISSLRHPDGASNPNLKEEVERVPGNGASTSDHEEDSSERRSKNLQIPREEVRTVTGKARDDDEEEEDEPPPVLPPSLPPAPASTRLHRRLFGGKAGPRHPSPRPQHEGYDSGHDSSSPRRAAALVTTVQCESSGYESVVRDSECSSFGSSQDSDPGEPHDPGGSKKVPVLQYCREDVERLERRWTEAQGRRIRELRAQQRELKQELAAAKTRLLIPASRWSYELHVEQSMDCRDPGFLEALDRETQILQKRVNACKSHILMVTCFDAIIKTQD